MVDSPFNKIYMGNISHQHNSMLTFAKTKVTHFGYELFTSVKAKESDEEGKGRVGSND